MNVIEDKQQYNEIWNKVYDTFHFQPAYSKEIKTYSYNEKHVRFHLTKLWNTEQENIVNNMMIRTFKNEELYALDWQHDCFIFSPKECIPSHFYDTERACDVYFPTYYPDGDYYLFLNKTFTKGLLGDPWQKEICIIGDELIKLFIENAKKLNIVMLND